jgi:hypothetical protein
MSLGHYVTCYEQYTLYVHHEDCHALKFKKAPTQEVEGIKRNDIMSNTLFDHIKKTFFSVKLLL